MDGVIDLVKCRNALADGIASVVHAMRHPNKHQKCSRSSEYDSTTKIAKEVLRCTYTLY